nr:hypothetical protein [Tanacetum cinerariifolium]
KIGEEIDQYVLFPVWSSGSTNSQNNDGDVAFDGKESDFDAKKPESDFNAKKPESEVNVSPSSIKEPESAVHVSPSSCEKTKKHDAKTKSEAKGKSPVELSTGVRNLSEEFKDFSSASTNRVNAASTPVLVV